MKNNILLTVFVLFVFILTTNGQGIDFFHGTWDKTIETAKKENKIIFVDAYTTWCGPCRRMQKNVFPQKQAGDFYNKNFINVKMNMETQEGMKFGLTYPVGAYPTLMFISPEGKIVFKKVGGQRLEGFLELGKKALKSYDKSPDLKKEWEKGNRDYDFVLKYLKALNAADKSTNKVALDYLRSNPDISKDNKAVLLFEATSECDSKLFELMTEKKYMKVIKDIYSKNEISNKIYKACWKTFEKSLEFEVEDIQKEAVKKMKKYNKKRYKEFVKKIDLVIAENNNDINGYIKAAKKYFKLLPKTENKILFIQSISNTFKQNKLVKDLIENLSKKTLDDDKTAKAYVNYIKILINNKKYKLAINELGYGIKIAEESKDGDSLRILKRYQRYLQKMELK